MATRPMCPSAGTALALLVVGLAPALVSAPVAAQDGCGDVTIARMNWASAEVIAEIDAIILAEGYGCGASLVAGDTVPTFTSMREKGEPDLAPEVWVNSIREPLAEAVEAEELIVAAQLLPDGGVEGWWIPRALADAHPDIRTVSDALERPELFPAPENDEVGAVHGCPAGWTCQITTENLFHAHDAGEKGFELVDTGSSAGLDGSISRAVERGEGWLGYYWSPTALLGRYDMVRLETPEHDPVEWKRCTAELGCTDPEPNGYPETEVFSVVTARFAEEAGVAMDYVTTRQWRNDTVNELLAWMIENQATGEEAAYHFLETREDVWGEWVNEATRERVKAAL